MDKRRKEQEALPWGAVPRRRASDWLMHKLRLPVVIASVLCSFIQADAAHAAQPPARKASNSRKLGLDIRVEGEGWGTPRRDAIETVLYSVADELMSRLPKKLSRPILVTHTDANPVALYERGSHGEYLIRLHAQGESWHLYVYEFAHEFCHILSNYDENIAPGVPRHNQWFEETLCETASLFTLKTLAQSWKETPPGPEMAAEADKLRRFFDLLISEGHRRLPPHTPLGIWLSENQEQLRNDPYLREKNEVVANLLLPLFQASPENWDALTYLNLDPADARNSLQEYLQHWYRNSPSEHRAFIGNMLSLLWQGDGPPPALGGGEAGPLATADTKSAP